MWLKWNNTCLAHTRSWIWSHYGISLIPSTTQYCSYLKKIIYTPTYNSTVGNISSIVLLIFIIWIFSIKDFFKSADGLLIAKRWLDLLMIYYLIPLIGWALLQYYTPAQALKSYCCIEYTVLSSWAWSVFLRSCLREWKTKQILVGSPFSFPSFSRGCQHHPLRLALSRKSLD